MMTKEERCRLALGYHRQHYNCGQSVLGAFRDLTGLTEEQCWDTEQRTAVLCTEKTPMGTAKSLSTTRILIRLQFPKLMKIILRQ